MQVFGYAQRDARVAVLIVHVRNLHHFGVTTLDTIIVSCNYSHNDTTAVSHHKGENVTIQRKQFGARLLPENHAWLVAQAAQQERSINWVLDKLLTEAREADEKVKGDDNAHKH